MEQASERLAIHREHLDVGLEEAINSFQEASEIAQD